TRFSIRFPGQIRRVLHLAATVYDVNETLDAVVTSHESLSAHGKPIGQDFSRCQREPHEVGHCTGKYALAHGTIRFAGTIPIPSHSNTLTITGGTGRYHGAEGTVLTEYAADGRHAKETITLER